MRLLPLLFALCIAAAAWLGTGSTAHAVPGFARQTGMSCNSCHFQHFPKLNAMGRRFKASGYSLSADEPIEDEGLKLVPKFSASLRTAVEYQHSTPFSDASSAGKLQLPATHGLALILGGAAAEGIGGYVELSPSVDAAKLSLTTPMDALGAEVGMTAFTSHDSGAAFGFDLMNASSYGMGKPFERAPGPVSGSIARLKTNVEATGVAFHAAGSDWFTAVTPYLASGAGAVTDVKSPFYLVRAAWMPTVFGQEFGVGGGIFTGGGTVPVAAAAAPAGPTGHYRVQDAGHGDEGPAATTSTPGKASGTTASGTPAASAVPAFEWRRAWFLDVQSQGKVFDRDLGVYVLYGNGDAPGAQNAYGGQDHAPAGLAVSAEYSVLPWLGLIGSAGLFDNGAATGYRYDQYGLGLNVSLAQNVQIQSVYQWLLGANPDHDLSARVSVLF